MPLMKFFFVANAMHQVAARSSSTYLEWLTLLAILFGRDHHAYVAMPVTFLTHWIQKKKYKYKTELVNYVQWHAPYNGKRHWISTRFATAFLFSTVISGVSTFGGHKMI